MEGSDTLFGVILAAVGYAFKVVFDWLRDRWRHQNAIEQEHKKAMIESTTGRFTERKPAYEAFRGSVDLLLDAMDSGAYPMALLYEVRDNWGQLRRIAPTEVIAAANTVVQALKPAIDAGPNDVSTVRILQALRAFDDACRGDAGLGPVPHIDPISKRGDRRHVVRNRFRVRDNSRHVASKSEVLDQPDDEAALSRLFMDEEIMRPQLLPNELRPRR